MKKVFSIALAAVAAAFSTAATTGCVAVFLDEPEMPASLR